MMIPMTCLEVKWKRTHLKLSFVCHFIFLVNLSFGWVSRQSEWPRGLRRGSAADRFAGIAGSNPARGLDVFLVSVVCCQVEVSASS